MVRLHRSTEHRAYALWACPRAAINSQRPPPAATCEHKLAWAFNLRVTHENTLVMRRSVAHFSCRQEKVLFAALPNQPFIRNKMERLLSVTGFSEATLLAWSGRGRPS